MKKLLPQVTKEQNSDSACHTQDDNSILVLKREKRDPKN